MTILLIACSRQAFHTMEQFKEKWERAYPKDRLHCLVKCKSLGELSQPGSLTDCVGEWFQKADALLFISALGIAVRSIAPFLEHKSKDPAVLVMDESGKFCISLLSGHAGGANELTDKVAKQMGAIPVITTATDREGKFAVDEFARKNRLLVTDWELAKRCSVGILEGEMLGFFTEIPIHGKAPKELFYRELTYENALNVGEVLECKNSAGDLIKRGVLISYREWETLPFPETLQLIPQSVIAGIGCRKGVSQEQIGEAVEHCLREEKICRESLAALASIDLKKEEQGILAYCHSRELPFFTYTAEELELVEGDFSESEFVARITGVSNVCERSASLASGGRLICKKRVYDGVTVALAKKKGSMEF